MPYRDDRASAHARIAQLEAELTEARAAANAPGLAARGYTRGPSAFFLVAVLAAFVAPMLVPVIMWSSDAVGSVAAGVGVWLVSTAAVTTLVATVVGRGVRIARSAALADARRIAAHDLGCATGEVQIEVVGDGAAFLAADATGRRTTIAVPRGAAGPVTAFFSLGG